MTPLRAQERVIFGACRQLDTPLLEQLQAFAFDLLDEAARAKEPKRLDPPTCHPPLACRDGRGVLLFPKRG